MQDFSSFIQLTSQLTCSIHIFKKATRTNSSKENSPLQFGFQVKLGEIVLYPLNKPEYRLSQGRMIKIKVALR